MGKGVSTFRIR